MLHKGRVFAHLLVDVDQHLYRNDVHYYDEIYSQLFKPINQDLLMQLQWKCPVVEDLCVSFFFPYVF